MAVFEIRYSTYSTFRTTNKTNFYLSFSTCFFLQMKAEVNLRLIMRPRRSLSLCFRRALVDP